MCRKLPILVIALVALGLLTVGLGVASAQTTDVYKVNYYANARFQGRLTPQFELTILV